MNAASAQNGQLPPLDDERAAACALAGLGGIGSQSLALIRSSFGTLAAAASQGAQAIARTPGLRADGLSSLHAAPDLQERGRWLLEKAQEIGARVITLQDPEYPELLRAVPSAPPVLYVQGPWSEARRVAVVGTRKVDDYGKARTRSVVDHLCAAGVEVVSGGAAGVDAEAHQRALDRGGRTVAVIGSGLLNPYPRSNGLLFKRLAKEGTLVSEFALDAGGITTHFPQRNRTIAGLSEAVVITRGDSGSGALTTCLSAQKLGRPIFAVPGNVGDPLAAATNAQLVAGARAVVAGDEMLFGLGLKSSLTGEQAMLPVAPTPEPANLPPAERQVLGTLGPAPRHIDEIAEAAGMPTASALAALLRLELDGLCAARPGKYFLRR